MVNIEGIEEQINNIVKPFIKLTMITSRYTKNSYLILNLKKKLI